MAKIKKSSSSIQVKSDVFVFVIRHGIKIYPVSKFFKWYIEVDNNGKIKRFDKIVIASELENAIAKTYEYYYKLLNDKR